MESDGGAGELTFVDYLRPVWRFKYIVVLVTVLAVGATYWYSNRATKVYQTATQLYVGQSDLQQLLNPGVILGASRLADDAILVTTPAVAQVVKTNLHLPYPADDLLGYVAAAPGTSGDFLTITAQSSSPKFAAELANGFAQAYLQINHNNVVHAAQTQLRAVQNQLAHTGNGPTSAATRASLRTQLASLESIVADTPSVGQQVVTAGVPGSPTSPKPTRNAIFAGVLALVLGVILSYLFDRRDRRIRNLAEIETLFEVPVLATVPHLRQAEPTREDPYGIPAPLREPCRSLRVNMEIARGTRDAKVIMVTSALASEGKSTLVRNLAITYRDAGVRVAVVEGDLRRPVLAGKFGVEDGPGLYEALAHEEPPSMQRVPDGVLDGLLPRAERMNGSGGGRLDVLVAGSAPEDPTVLLTDDRMQRLMAGLALAYDIVLVDSPPVLLVSDALALMSMVDGVIIVARAGTITSPAAVRLRSTMDRVTRVKHAHVMGAVINDVVDEQASYYRPYAKTARPAGEGSDDGAGALTPERAAS